jgi:transcriptional regulator with XRE-family HTH domain
VLGSIIRQQRQVASLSLREMAALTQVSNAYLSQVERGLHQPSLKVLFNIADALRVSPQALLAQAGFFAEPLDTADEGGAPDPDEAKGPGSHTPAPVSTEQAILADERLGAAEKQALLSVYRSFLERA